MDIKIVVPNMGESVSEGEILEWLKKEGDAVEADEEIVVIETDKITVELPSPASGVLKKILKGPGQVVAIGEAVGLIDSTGAAIRPPETSVTPAAAPDPPPPPPAPATPAQASPAAKASPVSLSPAVRRLVKESEVDPAAIAGTGRGGRILKSDVLDHLDGLKKSPGTVGNTAATPSAPAPAPPAQSPAPAPDRPEERVRMTRIRRRTAERLIQSQRETATLTTFNDVDLSKLIALRGEYKESFKKKYGIGLGFMSFFIKASIEALKAFPAANAVIEGEEIVYRNYYDIGVAVSTDRGLVVPVIRNAERLSFAECEMAVVDLATRAREGRLTMEELTGGTFSITNGGVFGSLLSTPILNPPQSAILGMHRIEKRAVVMEDDSIVARPMMYLALSYDHRLIDGRDAVKCLVRIKECLADPTRVLLEI